MPYKSEAQGRLMRAVAHGWKPTRIEGPTRAVAKEFVEAEKKGKRRGGMAGYRRGGSYKSMKDYARGGMKGYQYGGAVMPMPYRGTQGRGRAGVLPGEGRMGGYPGAGGAGGQRGALRQMFQARQRQGQPRGRGNILRGRVPPGGVRGRMPPGGPRGPGFPGGRRPGPGGLGGRLQGALSQYGRTGGGGFPGRGGRIAPPPGKYPGGRGNPMLQTARQMPQRYGGRRFPMAGGRGNIA